MSADDDIHKKTHIYFHQLLTLQTPSDAGVSVYELNPEPCMYRSAHDLL